MPHAPGHWGWEGPGPDPVPETKANQQIYVPPTTTTRPVSDAGNLSSLFGELNRISAPQIMMQNRAGGGTGGGSLALEGNMDPNPLSRFNPYLGMNVTSFNKGGKYRYDEGGQLTPKEMKKVQSLGRNGDTMLAHINPQEAAMLKAMGGSGTINPYTGLREYGWLSSFVKSILGGASDVAQAVINPLNDVVAPIFNAAGEVLDPLADVTTDVVQAAGDNVVSPIVEGIAGGSRDVLEFVGDKGSDIVRGAGGFVHDIYENLSDLFSGGDYSIQFPDYTKGQIEDPSREPQARGEGSEQSGLKLSPQSKLAQLQKDKKYV